jgi:HEAT repeat protein
MRYAILIVGAGLWLLAAVGNLEAQTKDKGKPTTKDKDAAKDKAADKDAAMEVTEVGGKKLDKWIAEIRHADPGVRENAIRTVPYFGRPARKAVKALITELKDLDPSLRVNAAISLGLIGMDEADLTEGVNALKRVLQTDNQVNVKFQAAMTLGKLGADAKAAAPELRKALLDPYASWELRQAAALALAGTGWEVKELEEGGTKRSFWVAEPKTVKELVTAAKTDGSATVRKQALTSLIYLGMPYDPADLQNEKTGLLAVIRQKNQDPIVGIWARVAYMRVDKISEVYLKDISHLLKHNDLPVRTNAAQALAAIGPSANSGVSDLLVALEDKDPLVVVAAMSALVQIADDSTAVVTALERLEKETKNDVLKQAAKQAIEQLKIRANEIREENLKAPKPPDAKMPKGSDAKTPPKKKNP